MQSEIPLPNMLPLAMDPNRVPQSPVGGMFEQPVSLTNSGSNSSNSSNIQSGGSFKPMTHEEEMNEISEHTSLPESLIVKEDRVKQVDDRAFINKQMTNESATIKSIDRPPVKPKVFKKKGDVENLRMKLQNLGPPVGFTLEPDEAATVDTALEDFKTHMSKKRKTKVSKPKVSKPTSSKSKVSKPKVSKSTTSKSKVSKSTTSKSIESKPTASKSTERRSKPTSGSSLSKTELLTRAKQKGISGRSTMTTDQLRKSLGMKELKTQKK